MSEKDIFDSIDKALDIVDKAVERQDFNHMCQDLKKAVEPMKNAGRYDQRLWAQQTPPPPSGKKSWREQNAGRKMNGGRMEGSGNAFYGTYRAPGMKGYSGNIKSSPKENPYFKEPAKGGSTALLVGGLIGAILNGLMTGIMLVGAVITVGTLAPAIFFGGVTAGFGVMSLIGSRKRKLMERYERYRSILEKRQFAQISELASAVGLSEKKTRSDLRKLLQQGYFKQGHFDAKEKNFIVSEEMYQMYRATEENAARMRAEEVRKEAEENDIPPEVLEILDKGEEYIRRIHEANDNIPDRGITDKLDRMEQIVTRIFDEVRKNPALAGNLNMFMDYYLPMTIKLVGAYEDMDKKAVQGENIQNAKKEIAGSLDTINDAFEKLLDSFFADTAMDVSTDISVLKTMMKQEGLTDDDLTALRKKQKMQAQIETGPTLSEEYDALSEEGTPEGMVAMPLGGEEDF